MRVRFFGRERALVVAVALLLAAGATSTVPASAEDGDPAAAGEEAAQAVGPPETHNRASQLTWQRVSAQSVRFTSVSSFRRSYYGAPNVGDTFSDPSLTFGDGSSATPTFTVTSVDPVNDVLTARTQIDHTYSGTGPFTASLGSCCRLSRPLHRNNPDADYGATTVVDLTATTSPSSSTAPIVDCAADSLCLFSVPAADPEGLALRWRLATSSEAGGGFSQPTGATVDATTGVYRWDTHGADLNVGGESFFSTQVIVEKRRSGTVVGSVAVDFFIRVGARPPVTAGPYVAMGDSYSSGHGAGPYTNEDCKRSDNAYPMVDELPGFEGQPRYFIACSGAETRHILTDRFHGERPQLAQLRTIQARGPVRLITLSIGGNDLGFAGLLTMCQAARLDPRWWKTCERSFEEAVRPAGGIDALLRLMTSRLTDTYLQIRRAAPTARLIVLGYPAIYPSDPERACNVKRSDAAWLHSLYERINRDLIQVSALAAGATYLDTTDAFQGHEVCNRAQAVEWANGIGFDGPFHPNALGHAREHELLEQCVEGTYDGCRRLGTQLVAPNQNVASSWTVGSGAPLATFSTSWPGSDVVLTLRSPSGAVVNRSTNGPNVVHTLTATSESYAIVDPEPGVWTVNLFGADVDAGGEPVDLSIEQAEPAPPSCGGLTVTVDLAQGQVPTDGPDVIRGTAGPDVVDALGGADVVCSRGGDDVVTGGQGNDTVRAGGGVDTARGGRGRDTLRGGGGDDRLSGGKSDDLLIGGGSTDTCVGGGGTDVATSCESLRSVP